MREQQQELQRLETIAQGGSNTTGKVEGGTARFNLNTDTDYVDPALAYYQISWQFEYATCAKLLNYPDVAGPKGSKLVPEVASGLPTVSPDGKTYTFTIRKGFKFSPPSNQPVTAQTFKFVIDRVLNPRMQSPGAQFISDIVGAEDVLNHKATSPSGVTVKGDKLTIHLTKKAPDFLSRIAMPFFCAEPTSTPVNPNGVGKIAGAGPYYISSWTPKRQLILKRNPNYTGSRPHNLNEIIYTVGVPSRPRRSRSRRARPTTRWTACRPRSTRSSAPSTARAARPRRTTSSSTS